MNELCTVVAVIKLSGVVAIDATRAALGPWAGSVTSILVGLSVFGSMNGSIICGARYLVKNQDSFSQTLLWPLLDNVKLRSNEAWHSYIRMSLSPSFLIPLTSTTHIFHASDFQNGTCNALDRGSSTTITLPSPFWRPQIHIFHWDPWISLVSIAIQYSAAREGQIPKYLGFVTSESRSPYIAHLVQVHFQWVFQVIIPDSPLC